MRLPALATAALAWLALACSPAAGEPVSILWLVAQGGLTPAMAAAAEAAVERESGVPVRLEVRELRSPDPEFFLIAAKRAMAGADDSLVFGLTLQGVQALAQTGMLASIPQDQVGVGRSRSLYIGSSNTRASGPEAVLAVPLAVSATVVCYDPERLGLLADHRPSIEEIAWGKLTDRVAVPDPRLDPVGRSVLLSIVEAAGGLSEGWSLMDEFDRSVEVYSSSGDDACRTVADGRADLGFTSIDRAEKIGRAGLDFQLLDRGALVPISFAAALDPFARGPREEVARVLRWVVGEHLDRELQELEQLLASRRLDFDAQERAEAKGVFEFVPIEELVREWAARYDYRALKSRS